jgi:hypothetical protein
MAMNERIKEFAKQAGFYKYGDDFEDIIEKFAELIVRECLAHGKLTQSQTVVNGSEEYNAGREMGIEVFMNQIKKHFGVEE